MGMSLDLEVFSHKPKNWTVRGSTLEIILWCTWISLQNFTIPNFTVKRHYRRLQIKLIFVGTAAQLARNKEQSLSYVALSVQVRDIRLLWKHLNWTTLTYSVQSKGVTIRVFVPNRSIHNVQFSMQLPWFLWPKTVTVKIVYLYLLRTWRNRHSREFYPESFGLAGLVKLNGQRLLSTEVGYVCGNTSNINRLEGESFSPQRPGSLSLQIQTVPK